MNTSFRTDLVVLVVIITLLLLVVYMAGRYAQTVNHVKRLLQDASDRSDLLSGVVEDSPTATLVLDDRGRVVYASASARVLIFNGTMPPEASLAEVLQSAPEPLRRALGAERTELFVFDREGEREVYQVTKRVFGTKGSEMRTVITVHPITAEILREEVIAYKKLLRVIGHELNNSLAPVASLAATGKRIVAAGPSIDLGELFDTIAERVEHLRTFLLRYAELARLPLPRCRDVVLAPIFDRIVRLFPGTCISVTGTSAYCDEVQLEQVLVNLVKNAIEAGSTVSNIKINAHVREDGTLGITVQDGGQGLSDEVLVSALIPFFTTKPGGTGLGLAVCREIVEAHGGRLRLRNRECGGAEVILRIPGREKGTFTGLSWTLTRP